MTKTYTFTEEDLLNNCRKAFLLSTIQLIIMSNIEVEEKEEHVDKVISQMVGLFIN